MIKRIFYIIILPVYRFCLAFIKNWMAKKRTSVVETKVDAKIIKKDSISLFHI